MFGFLYWLLFKSRYNILRSTEEAVRGRQYGPCPLMQPEKCSFEDGIDGRGWPRMASEVLLGFTVRLMLIDNIFIHL